MHHDPNSSRGLIWYAVLVFVIFGSMMSNLKFLRVFTLRSSSVWIINTIMFAKLNE